MIPNWLLFELNSNYAFEIQLNFALDQATLRLFSLLEDKG